MKRNPLGKFKKLLEFHAAMARKLAIARKCGGIQTAASFKAALMTNAKVLRHKILFNKVGERIS